MSYTYNVNTNIGKVRLYAQDNVEASAAFSDEELQIFLDAKGGDVYRAASMAMIVLAGNKAKLAIRRSAGDYSEDLTALAKSLREQAKELLELAGLDAADATAELQTTDFAVRDFVQNETLEGSL